MSQYSELLRAIADGKRLETAHAGEWHPMTEKAAFERMARGDDIEWRDAPKVMRQVAREVPAPMSRFPVDGSSYYVPNTAEKDAFTRYVWRDDLQDHIFFFRGLCYSSQKSAIARAEAMLQIESV